MATAVAPTPPMTATPVSIPTVILSMCHVLNLGCKKCGRTSTAAHRVALVRRDWRATDFSAKEVTHQVSDLLAVRFQSEVSCVVLGWRFLSAKDVAAGRVVEPFNLVLSLESTFYLVYPEAHSHRPNITALREWLMQEVREDENSGPGL